MCHPEHPIVARRMQRKCPRSRCAPALVLTGFHLTPPGGVCSHRRSTDMSKFISPSPHFVSVPFPISLPSPASHPRVRWFHQRGHLNSEGWSRLGIARALVHPPHAWISPDAWRITDLLLGGRGSMGEGRRSRHRWASRAWGRLCSSAERKSVRWLRVSDARWS
jgi:hypothetical protein